MPLLSLTLSGANGKPHDWTHVSTPFGEVQTLLNTTGLDSSNIQENGLLPSNIRTNANIDAVRIKVRNATGGSLSAGTLVYFSGTYSDGTTNYPTVAKAVSHATAGSNYFSQGLLVATTANGADGTAAVFYELSGVDTSSTSVGDLVYLDTTAGGWTKTRPTGGQYIQVVGTVTVVHASTGRIAFSFGSVPEFLTGGTSGLGATVQTFTVQSASGAAADMYHIADAGEDNADKWKISVADGGVRTWESYTSGSYVAKMALDTSGNVTVAGELDAVTLDISGNADIDGTLEADAITLGGTALGALYSPIAGGSGIVTTGALNSGSITSGFGTIDTGSSTITTTGVVTAGGFTIGSAAITEAELEILDGATVTTTEFNLIDGDTARGTTSVASGDGILINDGGTMRQTNVDTVSTYFASHSVGGGNIVTTGALNSGSITSGFGTIDTGSSTITTTGVITAGGFTIGSAAITEAELEILDGASVTTAELNILDGVTSTAAELNILDGVTSTAAELNVLDAVTGGTVTASLAVVVDSNKDIGSFRNITLTGELDAGSLDVSGDADIDGTLEADAITLGGTALGSLYSPIAGGSGITTTGTVTSGTWSGVIDGSATMTLGSDATGDVYYRDASGFLERLGASTAGYVLTTGGAGTIPAWEAIPTASADITSVVAGAGMTGGATSGDATLNVIGGDGITANSDDVAITAAQTTVTSMLNAALALGRDADNQIKFGTDDQIIFEVAGGDGVTFKASGEIEATTLDISGDADIDGTLEADAITLGGTALGSLYSPIAGGSGIVTTGALDSGSITSGFGTSNTGSSTITTSGVITGGGFTIGSAVVDETELEILDGATVTTAELNILDGVTSTAAELNILDGVTSTAAELNILDGVTSTAAEINLIDGGTARGTDAVATGDGLLVNDGGVMKMTNVDTVSTYFSSHNVGGGNIVTTGALNSGSITSGFGTIDTGSSTITTTGVITGGGFTIGSAVIVESELEMIDGITAGTVAASKAAVVDANKDIGSFRNVTLTGELDAATGDFSGDVDVDGTLETDALTIGGTAILANDANNRVTTATGSGTFNGESALTFDGTALSIGATSEVTTSVDTVIRFGGGGFLSSTTSEGAGEPVYLAQNAYDNDGTWKYIINDETCMIGMQNGIITFNNGPSGGAADSTFSFNERMRIDSAGLVGIGGTPTEELDVIGSTAGATVASRIYNSDNSNTASHVEQLLQVGGASGGDPKIRFAVTGVVSWNLGVDNSDSDKFKIAGDGGLGSADLVTVTTGGFVGIGYNDPEAKLHVLQTGDDQIAMFRNSNGAGFSTNRSMVHIDFSAQAPDSTSYRFLQCEDSTSSSRCIIYSDGTVSTAAGNSLASDERLKTNIADASDKLADLMRLRVRNFEWTPEFHPAKVGEKKIGFIAQELETVFPSLIMEDDIARDNSIKEKLYDAEDDTQYYTADDDTQYYVDGDDLPDGKQVGDVKVESQIPEGEAIGDVKTESQIPEGKAIGDVKVAAKEHESVMRKSIKDAFAPILVKALQEVTTRLEAAEAKITALESA